MSTTSTTSTAGQVQRRRDRRRYVALLLGCVGLVVAFGVQLILLIPTTYTATSAVALRPQSAEVPADVLEMLGHEYGVAIGSGEAAAEVQDASPSSRSSAAVSVSTVQDPGTATLRIVVASTNRSTAIDVANRLAEHAVTLSGGDTTARVVQIVEASPEGVSAVPPRRLYLTALLGLAVLVVAGGLYRIRDRTSEPAPALVTA